MNLKDKIFHFVRESRAVVAVIAILLLASIALIYLWEIKSSDITLSNSCENTGNKEATRREKTNEELSPDGSKKVTRYEVSYSPDLFDNNHTTYLDNKVIIAVTRDVGNAEREYYIFTGEERTNDPHWLGSNHVFFKSYCGSSCQGLTLVDINTRQKWQGVISYLPYEESKTHFSGWFDESFELEGSIDEVYAILEDNKPYLVFDLINENRVESGQKRFLFTGKSLDLEEK